MNVTMRSRYGVRGLVGLARLSEGAGGAPVALSEVSASQGIPEKFLEQLFLSLKRAGILRSQRGVRGGFAFARPPAEITVLDVVEVLDGAVAVADCSAGECGRVDGCGSSTLWMGLTDLVRDYLRGTTIADVTQRELDRAGTACSYDI